MAWAKNARLTPFKSVILRLVMLSIGRFFPNLVRRLLQKLLVTGRRNAPFHFKRTIRFDGSAWIVEDQIVPDGGWGDIRAAGISGHQTSVTTIMARVWQQDQLQPWTDLTGQIANLGPKEPLRVTRRFGGDTP